MSHRPAATTTAPATTNFQCCCFPNCSTKRFNAIGVALLMIGMFALCFYALLYNPTLLGNRTVALFTSYACLAIAIGIITAMAVKACRRAD